MKQHISFFDLLEIDQEKGKVTLEISKLNNIGLDRYQYLIENLFEIILNNFIIKNKPILLFLNQKFVREYTIAEIYILFLFLKNNVEFNIPININDLITHPNMTSKDVHKVIEILLQRHKAYFVKHNIDLEKLADIASDIVESITKLSIIYSWLSPTSISLYDLIQFAKRNPYFNKLINMKLNDSMSIKEIEDTIPLLEQELLNCIKNDKKNCLYQYVSTGSVKIGQLRQMLTPVGPRMDIDKTILPYPIKGNFLNGLEDVVEAYSEAVVARSALIDKDKHIRDAGYESRKLDLNNINTFIHPTIKDCGTKHYLDYFVETESHLKMIRYKYQVLKDGSLKEIDINNKKLIGEHIKLRSHAFCALTDHPGYVCQTCYGSNSNSLFGTRVGAFPSVCIQNPGSNLTISSKHHQETNAAVIKSKTIEKFFNLSQDKCYLKTEIDYSKIKLVIDKLFYENMMENINNSDEDDEYDLLPINQSRCYIEETVHNKNTGELDTNQYYFDDLDNIFLYLSSEILEEKGAIKVTPTSETVEIYFGKIDLSIPIIDIRIISEGIVYQVKRLINIIDSQLTDELYALDPNRFVKDICDIMKELEIPILSQYVETMLYNQIKSDTNLSIRPDFRQDEVSFRILSIKNSIMHKDVYTSLSFEKYNNQLKKIGFYNRNLEAGAFQPFFKTTKKFM